MAVAALALAPASAQDTRLVTRVFDQGEVVRLDGRMGVQATIGFQDGEKIENVAVGDADKWQIAPNKRADLLFVKPLESSARTNMTVVTDRRTYFFDLVAAPQGRPVYMMRFTYGPKPPSGHEGASGDVLGSLIASGQAPVAAAGSPPEAPQAVPTPASAGIDPALLNFAWAPRGARQLLPLRVYDDGTSTYLLWASNQPVPTVLLANEKGEEAAVTPAQRGNTRVIDAVPRVIYLSNGKVRAALENRNLPAAKPSDQPPATDSSVSDLPVPVPADPVAAAASVPVTEAKAD